MESEEMIKELDEDTGVAPDIFLDAEPESLEEIEAEEAEEADEEEEIKVPEVEHFDDAIKLYLREIQKTRLL